MPAYTITQGLFGRDAPGISRKRGIPPLTYLKGGGDFFSRGRGDVWQVESPIISPATITHHYDEPLNILTGRSVLDIGIEST